MLVGLLALGEGMPSTLRMQALRLLSWLCITAGVSALAGGKGAPSCALNQSISQPAFSWGCVKHMHQRQACLPWRAARVRHFEHQ